MNKKFYGEIFMEEEKLKNNGIYYPIKIDYYKIEEDAKENEIKYGIEIVKTEYKDNEEKVEINKMYELSNKEKEIDEILNIFKNNQVTPVSANEIVADLLYKI